MATSLADPPAPAAGKQPAAPSAAPPAGDDGLGVQPRVCAKCGAPMASGQDWCFQCGAGAPGSLDTHAHRWRSSTAVLSAVALLIAGAAAAAYAALSKSSAKPRPALAQAPAAAASPPAATVTPPPTTPKVAAPGVKLPVPLPKAPKVPLNTAAPKPAPATSPATTTPSTPSATTTPAAGQRTPGGTNTTQKQPPALVLDTNAASTYNPYAYPASNFGDPSLAIDGEKSTSWTALVDPAVAPKMAEGLVIDLKTAQKVSALALTSSTPGMTVQVYGATGSAPPASITDPAWVPLSRLVVDDKRYQRIPLGHSKQAFRFVVLWISKAPASAVGTPSAPGHVRVDELELFPAR